MSIEDSVVPGGVPRPQSRIGTRASASDRVTAKTVDERNPPLVDPTVAAEARETLPCRQASSDGRRLRGDELVDGGLHRGPPAESQEADDEDADGEPDRCP